MYLYLEFVHLDLCHYHHYHIYLGSYIDLIFESLENLDVMHPKRKLEALQMAKEMEMKLKMEEEERERQREQDRKRREIELETQNKENMEFQNKNDDKEAKRKRKQKLLEKMRRQKEEIKRQENVINNNDMEQEEEDTDNIEMEVIEFDMEGFKESVYNMFEYDDESILCANYIYGYLVDKGVIHMNATNNRNQILNDDYGYHVKLR